MIVINSNPCQELHSSLVALLQEDFQGLDSLL